MTGSGKREAGSGGSEGRTYLLIHVQPGARRTEIVGWHGEAIKIRVAAPPVDGAANEELCRFLAKRLDLPIAKLRLTAGNTGRRKRVEVAGLDLRTAFSRLGLGPAP